MSHFAKDLVVTFGVVVMLGATLFFVKKRQESNRLDRLREMLINGATSKEMMRPSVFMKKQH